MRQHCTIMSEIAFELKNQYSISYFSSNTVRDNIRRRVRVALDPSTSNDLQVRFRAGYFASKPGKLHPYIPSPRGIHR